LHPPNQLLSEAPFPRVKRPEREADHSSAYSTEDKKPWVYASTSPYVFMVWCLIKQMVGLHGAVPN